MQKCFFVANEYFVLLKIWFTSGNHSQLYPFFFNQDKNTWVDVSLFLFCWLRCLLFSSYLLFTFCFHNYFNFKNMYYFNYLKFPHLWFHRCTKNIFFFMNTFFRFIFSLLLFVFIFSFAKNVELNLFIIMFG